jgi:hypothetical protein
LQDDSRKTGQAAMPWFNHCTDFSTGESLSAAEGRRDHPEESGPVIMDDIIES